MRPDYAGKRGGNAGDDYHELWALRQALELLRPSGRLREVTVEGVAAEDDEGRPEAWDGVDVAKYYGTEAAFDEIHLVQLKYSGSAPDKPWTIARLCATTNKARTNSVIRRLADAWREMGINRPEVHGAERISVHLVSNQPVQEEVLSCLRSGSACSDWSRLKEASGLDETAFGRFAARLDLSACGGASRFAEEEQVIAFLAQIEESDVRGDLRSLREFIYKRMLPEGRDQPIIRESLLGALGHTDTTIFFPCPSRVRVVAQVVPREMPALLAQELRTRQKVCLHGGGGEGKTTILQSLADHLPSGSEVIVYDCYGGGTYLDSDGHRHRPSEAFLQIANDYAARLLLPPMLPKRDADHPRRFSRQLKALAAVSSSRAKDALIVLVVDAADNAVTAASECAPPESSFVPDFVRLGDLPDNVRLLLTARTGRLARLALPSDVVLLRLEPFSAEESRQHAELHLGQQPMTWHLDFHGLSGGNPRVQGYAVSFAEGDPQRALGYLAPGGKDLDVIFQNQMREAQQKSGAKNEIAVFCAALCTLPKPIPISHLAAIARVSEDQARDIVADLAPALTMTEGQVGLADEDFEDFVRRHGGSHVAEAEVRASDRLYELRTADPYAARHAAALALRAGQPERLLELAREDHRRYPVLDPIERGAIHRHRLAVAMHACRKAGQAVEAASVLLEGAHAMRTDDAVRELLCGNLELSVAFARDRILELTLRELDKRPVHGALLLQLMGRDGVAGDKIPLRRRWREFRAWMEARSDALARAEDEEDQRRGRWSLNADDVAAHLVGVMHAEGLETARDRLAGAHPRGFRRSILVAFAMRLVHRGEVAQLEAARGMLASSAIERAAFDVVLGLAGRPINGEALQRVSQRLTRRRLLHPGGDALGPYAQSRETLFPFDVLDACDLALLQAGDARDQSHCRGILEAIAHPSRRSLKSLISYSESADAAARAFALLSILDRQGVTLEAFLSEASTPDSKDAKAKRQREHDLREATARWKPLLKLYEVRAKVILGKVAPSEAPTELAAAVAEFRAARREEHRYWEHRQQDARALSALVMLAAVRDVDGGALFKVVGGSLTDPGVEQLRYEAAPILRRASACPPFRDAFVEFASREAELQRSAKVDSGSKMSGLAELALLLLPLDEGAAEHVFKAALEAAAEVNPDMLPALASIERLAGRARGVADQERTFSAAGRFAAVAQAVMERVDRKHFPEDAVSGALAALSPSVALATSARFAELDLCSAADLLEPALLRIEADQVLDGRTLAAFLPILGSSSYKLAERLLRRGAEAHDAELAEEVAAALLREGLSGSETISEKLGQLGGMAGPWAAALVKAEAFMAVHETDRTKSSGPAKASSYTTEPTAADLKGVSSPQALLQLSDRFLKDDKPTPWNREQAVRRLLRVALPHQVPTLLDIVATLPEADSPYEFGRFLEEILAEQEGVLGATRWARDRLPSILEERLPEIARGFYWGSARLDRLLARTKATDAQVVDLIFAAVERHVEALSSMQLFHLISHLAEHLPPEETLGLMERHLEIMERVLEDADRIPHGFSDLPRDAIIGLSRHLYSELGHVDHVNRWRAAHAIRILARLGRIDVIRQIQHRYEEVTEPAFSHPEVPFYHLAARTWFMLSIARVAWEVPDAVRPMEGWLFEQGERTDFPHLLIREAARTALFGLQAASNSHSPAQHERIVRINRSTLPAAPKRDGGHKASFGDYVSMDRSERRFHFDWADTLAYWYTPLLKCFATPDAEVFLERAEAWIVDEWGVRDTPWEIERSRSIRSAHGRGYDLTNHRHGSIPRVERYQTYLEWQAMMLAGGALLSEWSLAEVDNPHDDWDTLPRWLRGWSPTLAPLWLSDLRGPKPLLVQLWQAPDPSSWHSPPSPDDMRLALGLAEPEWLTLSSRREVWWPEARETVRVECALVSRENATALRLALEASENSFQYRLAVNGKDDDLEVGSGEFILKSVLSDHHGDVELDIHDPWRGDVRAPGQVPHSHVLDVLGLRRDRDGWPIWFDLEDTPIIRGRAWSDPRSDNERRERGTSDGRELLIRRDALEKLMGAEGLDLIANVTFRRSTGRQVSGSEDPTKDREFDRIVILRAGGEIETGAGDIGRWS